MKKRRTAVTDILLFCLLSPIFCLLLSLHYEVVGDDAGDFDRLI